jgi:hypothetical protein
MNTDFRVSVDFFMHHKTKKLKKRAGDAGIMSLLRLWAYVAKIKPDGDISSMSAEDIEIAADWDGEGKVFVNAALDAGFLEEYEGEYYLYHWVENNPWAAESVERSDKARLSVMASKFPEIYKQLADEGYTAISKERYVRLTRGAHRQNERSTNVNNSFNERSTSVNAAPTPSPSPSPEPEPRNQGQKTIAAPPPDTASADCPEPPDVTPEERDILRVLSKTRGGYRYDYEKDLAQIRALAVEFPRVDMLGEVKKMAAWLIDKRPDKVKNPRLFMRNWIAGAARMQASPRASPVPAIPRHSQGVPDFDEIQRRFDEKYSKIETGGDVIDVEGRPAGVL